VEDEQRVELVAQFAHRGEELGRKCRSPPSPWIGSAMKQAMSWGLASKAARACRSDSASTASMSASGRMNGASMRGQSNLGNRATLFGSVLVNDSVYPLRPWKAPRR